MSGRAKKSKGDGKLKTYTISVPITGRVIVEVKAASKTEAIEKLWDRDEPWPDPDEWEVCEQVVEGNVFHGMHNEVEVIGVDGGGS